MYKNNAKNLIKSKKAKLQKAKKIYLKVTFGFEAEREKRK